HQLTVIGTDGTMTWNHADSAVHRFDAATRAWETRLAPDGFERDWMFFDEMRHFLACLRGEEQPLCTLSDGRAALARTLAAKQALAASRLSALASSPWPAPSPSFPLAADPNRSRARTCGRSTACRSSPTASRPDCGRGWSTASSSRPTMRRWP